ncbi:conserved hypothetical protein [Magnetospirillum sp. LM-5]|uniref:HepT-like ribonuclease domain-containing protein n=1 Tax=Magnetospirillum sp. LM-5 TaxID=2681466 RepID=UPI001383B229|nr:DUF86 domain-containing protein [Magnetospirillum sp. LM-5]CAA7624029.1 conserved hypothetical protein [Magnetospirillum sp. LM-5]
MIRDWRDFLDDMRDHAETAQAFVGAMTWEEFQADIKTIFALARAIEIMGEAARRVPEDVRNSYLAIPWREIIGMRNVLAHNYDGADPRIIYDTATLFLPDLVEKLSAIIADLAHGDTLPPGSA